MKTQYSLKEISHLPKSDCSCEKCQGMCSLSRPCWGTPTDVKKLIENGFANRLMLDYYEGELDKKKIPYTEILSPALVGSEGKRAPFWPVGRCTFYTVDGKCEIHDIKPTEGRVVNHEKRYDGLHESLAKSWGKRDGLKVIKQWNKENK